jgi:hypothetical protein
VEEFIQKFAINHENFDYAKTLDMETMDDPQKIMTGPTIIT